MRGRDGGLPTATGLRQLVSVRIAGREFRGRRTARADVCLCRCMRLHAKSSDTERHQSEPRTGFQLKSSIPLANWGGQRALPSLKATSSNVNFCSRAKQSLGQRSKIFVLSHIRTPSPKATDGLPSFSPTTRHDMKESRPDVVQHDGTHSSPLIHPSLMRLVLQPLALGPVLLVL